MPAPAELLEEGRDFVIDGGLWVFTRTYLERRGYCCKSGCRHCPYGFRRPAPDAETIRQGDKKP